MAIAQSGMTFVNAPFSIRPMQFSVANKRFSRTPSFGILSTHPPTLCGLATFSVALATNLTELGAEVGVVQIEDGNPSQNDRVVGHLENGSPASVAACSALLNRNDIAIIQHEYGLYGGADGDEVVEIMRGLTVPAIVVAHTILKDPTPHQRSVLEEVVGLADQVVVMSDTARERLRAGFTVDPTKVVTIPHGAALPTSPALKRSGRPTLLTWGLIGPGKGIERVIEAMVSLKHLPGRPQYLIAGQTHPKVLASQGEAYREGLVAQAERLGVADSVSFDARYRSPRSVTTLIQTAAAVVLPYDSKDQVTSGVLVDSLASGRPVVATAFPHAQELLSGGAGSVVAHDDPAALVHVLNKLLTDPRIAGTMANEARQLAPTMAWPVVATAYVDLAQRLLSARPAVA